MPHTFKYRALLSYSPADSGAARRVRRCLEGFRVDHELVGRSTPLGPVPDTLRPIHSDRHDFFASPSLGPATVAALADSAALIILASPHSVQSRYVNKLIKFFKLRHPERPVIVRIVEGALDDPENASSPSVVRFAVAPDWTDPAAAPPPDLNESDGFELAIAKVVSRLIGLGVWDIYRRAESTRHHRARICIAVATAVAVVATTSGALSWRSYQSKLAVAEFAALVERYKLASPTQAAAPGAKESFAEAITAIAEGAATDPKYAQALELLKAGKVAEAELPLEAAAEDKAMRVAQVGRQVGRPVRTAAAAYRTAASIAAMSDPRRPREYYAKAAQLDPSDIVGLFRNGWFQQEAGQFDAAEATYREVITSVEASNSEWVLWAYFGKGDIERERGHLDDALTTYREARAIAQNRARTDPANLGRQYDLGISNERIGDVLMALGDHAEALRFYRAQQQVLSGMADGDPDRANRQSDPAVSDISAGNVPVAQDPLAEVLTSQQATLANIARLAKANPTSPTEGVG